MHQSGNFGNLNSSIAVQAKSGVPIAALSDSDGFEITCDFLQISRSFRAVRDRSTMFLLLYE